MPRIHVALGSSGHPGGGGQVLQTVSQRERSLPLGYTGRDRGEVHRHLKTWAGPVGGLDEGSGALQDTVPCLLPHPEAW